VETAQMQADSRMGRMEESIAELQKMLGIMRSKKPPEPAAHVPNSFGRAPDPCIIVARARTNAAKQQMTPALRARLQRAALPEEEIEIEGPQQRERFQTADVEGAPVEIHASSDKSQCQFQKEMLLKQIRR
ncbi:unnamed protein product, partial [Prorocentrum cordatum]